MGKGMWGIATLVERSSRFPLLIKLEAINSGTVVAALAAHILTLPMQLRQSLAWTRAKRCPRHIAFTIDTGVQIYFCDPKSPWQRGSNENTNALLCQYFPSVPPTWRSTSSVAGLDAVAAELIGRPR